LASKIIRSVIALEWFLLRAAKKAESASAWALMRVNKLYSQLCSQLYSKRTRAACMGSFGKKNGGTESPTPPAQVKQLCIGESYLGIRSKHEITASSVTLA
jgi:hypothetical protein